MSWFTHIRRGLLGRPTPTYDGIGGSRRAIAWQVGNPGAVAALAYTQNELRAKSRDLVRRNAWAAAGVDLELSSGNLLRAGIEFDRLGRRVAYHLYRSHPEDGALAPMSGTGGMDTVRVPAAEVIHLFRPLRPGQIRGEPWLARALVKLNELDQYDDAEAVRKKTAAMFAGFITRVAPEDNLLGEGQPDANGMALAGLEPGTMQLLEPGEDVKFSAPADVGASHAEFLRMQFRAVAAVMGITYEMPTGDGSATTTGA